MGFTPIEWALIGMAASAAAGTGYSVAAGESGKRAQKRAMQQQQEAQSQEAAKARRMERASSQRMAMANRQEADVSAIMAAAQEPAGGASGTMLTGPAGVSPQDLNLGRTSLLGG